MLKKILDMTWQRGFAVVVLPAILGGGLWQVTAMPLGWLMGAACVTGLYAMTGHPVEVPKVLHRASLVVIGSGVGLVLTPAVAAQMASWFVMMPLAALVGIALAAAFTAILSRLGRMSPATAFFSLLPGGVIEMAKIGGDHGADRTTIAALHTVRVGLVVGVLPLVLFAVLPRTDITAPADADIAATGILLIALALGAVGGWLGARVRLPAAWLLGAVLVVGCVASTGAIGGRLPPALVAAAQVVVGIALGARFERECLAAIPRALIAGVPVLLAIMAVMAALAVLCAQVMPQPAPTLVLAFSIGGMAEMVLTAKALNQDIALVAAFQAVRGVTVNVAAGLCWSRLRHGFNHTDRDGD